MKKLLVILTLLYLSLTSFAITGSTYDPPSMSVIEKTKSNFNGQKVSAVVTANTTQDIDLPLTDDHLLTGAQVDLSGACIMDEVQFKVVSGTTVVNQFIDWYASSFTRDMGYPAKIPAGLKLRVTYKNTCVATDVTVKINYFLHKILL